MTSDRVDSGEAGGGRVEFYVRFPMCERCPACGSELERVSFGTTVSGQWNAYWQFCSTTPCTWMGPPTIFRRKRRGGASLIPFGAGAL